MEILYIDIIRTKDAQVWNKTFHIQIEFQGIKEMKTKVENEHEQQLIAYRKMAFQRQKKYLDRPRGGGRGTQSGT